MNFLNWRSEIIELSQSTDDIRYHIEIPFIGLYEDPHHGLLPPKIVAFHYTTWLLAEVFGSKFRDIDIKQLGIYMPCEYNFYNDIIVISVSEPLPDLNREYFEENNLLGDTIKLIIETYKDRSDYSFTYPEIDEIFEDSKYLSIAFFIYTCYKLNVDPDIDAISEIDNKFLDYALGNCYGEFIEWDEDDFEYKRSGACYDVDYINWSLKTSINSLSKSYI